MITLPGTIIPERARPWSRGSPRALQAGARTNDRTTVLIATLRCHAPARCGAFDHERRVVAATEAGVGILLWQCHDIRSQTEIMVIEFKEARGERHCL
jgi:hypothetical protein